MEERGTPGYLNDGKEVGGKRERIASNEMCTFLILNISSLQLIPMNMIAYRSQYGSVNPAGIIALAIFATAVLARNSDDYENNMKYQPFYQNIEKEGMRIYG